MNKAQFQREVHHYRTQDRDQALRDAEHYTLCLDFPDTVVAVHFPNLGYGLMLDTAYRFSTEVLGLNLSRA